MKIKSINLHQFRGHNDLNIEFNDNLTVISGENGAGKSSILEAIALSISWIVAKIKNPIGRGSNIKLSDINNNFKETRVDFQFDDIGGITLNGKNIGGKIKSETKFEENLRDYCVEIQSKATDNIAQDLPIFAHYGVRRAVIDIPLRIRNKSHDSIFETYEDWNTGGANFKSFFEWFRNQEDIENEKLRYWNNNNHQSESGEFQPDRELSTVRRALESFMPNYTNVRINRRPLRMLIDKGNDTLDLNQLSDGEKIYFALIGDLCRRLVLANPTIGDPLQGEGIVLIDEIDLHLHPNWQKDIAVRLTETFPNIQFILTTHSSLVLNNVPNESIRMLTNNEIKQPSNTYGLPISIILKDEMGLTNEMPNEIEKLISDFSTYIHENNYNSANEAYLRLQQLNSQHPELVRMNFFLGRLKK